MKATIWHNSRCSKSRETLALLEAAGIDVTVIDYLKTPPSAARLRGLYAAAGMTALRGLRVAEAGAPSRSGMPMRRRSSPRWQLIRF